MSKSRIENRPAAVSSVESEFNKALVLHRLGQLTEAERVYRAILKSHHRHFDAAHLLGLILLQRGEAQAAESQLGRALSFAADTELADALQPNEHQRVTCDQD